MPSKRPPATKLTRIQARTRAIRGMGRVAMVAFCLSLGFVVVAAAFPQKRELDRLESKLDQVRRLEQQVLFERYCREVELKAVREDPEFFELHVRDRLGYSNPGERILTFSSENP